MRGEFIPTRKEAVKVVRKSNVLDQMPSKTQQQARISMVETRNHENTAQVTTAPAPAPTPAPAPAPVSAPVAAPAPVVAAAQTGPSLPPVSFCNFIISNFVIIGLSISVVFKNNIFRNCYTIN